MKKLILTAVVIIAFGASTVAQLSLRPQAGIQFTDLSYEAAQGELKGKTGIKFGVDLQIGGTFYVQPGINFNPLKLEIKDVGEISITKLNVPVMVGYKLFENDGSKAFGLRLFAGPNFAFSITDEISDIIEDITTDDLKKFHLAAIAGAGLDFGILFVDLAYKYGLTETISPRIGDGANLNGFLLNAGIRIGF